MRRIYDVRCTSCSEVSEVFGRATDEFRCGACDAPAKRIISPVRTHFDGTDPGFPGAHDKWARDHEKAAGVKR